MTTPHQPTTEDIEIIDELNKIRRLIEEDKEYLILLITYDREKIILTEKTNKLIIAPIIACLKEFFVLYLSDDERKKIFEIALEKAKAELSISSNH